MQTETVLSFQNALARLGVTDATLSRDETRALDAQGFLLLTGLIDAAWLERLRAVFERLIEEERQADGAQTGPQSGTRHLDGLIGKGPAFEGIITHPRLLAAAQHVLAAPFQVTGLGGRDPLPGYGQQGLHADAPPRAPGASYEIVTALWLLDEFTPENGATRVVPGTHLLTSKLPKPLAQPESHHPDERVILAPAGSALIFNGHLWHSGTRNRSHQSRRVLNCGFMPRRAHRYIAIEPAAIAALSPIARFLTGP